MKDFNTLSPLSNPYNLTHLKAQAENRVNENNHDWNNYLHEERNNVRSRTYSIKKNNQQSSCR